MTWRFIASGAMTGAANMAFDEEMAQAAAASPLPESVLRIYGWAPPAISVGYHQDMGQIDAAAAAAAGIDVVRRPTGGKAILHWNELTYAVVMPLGGMGPRGVYRFVHEALLRGLAKLRIDAALAGGDPGFRQAFRDPASVPCFSTSAKSEIQVEGRKLVGSAQRRFGPVILQHGSILLGPEHLRLTRFLRDGPPQEETLRRHTIDAAEVLGREVTFGEAAGAIRAGFEEYCDELHHIVTLPTLSEQP